MKKITLFVFILSITCMFISGVMGYYTVTKISFLTTLFSGFTGFYLICLHSYRVTSKVTRKFKDESRKAYNSISLFYQLEKLHMHQGARQFNAVGKKSKVLLRLIRQRFTENSLTQARFRQEVEAYSRQIIQNLEQLVFHKEAEKQVNPKLWQHQIRQLRIAGAGQQDSSLMELQQQLNSYERLGVQCQELLSENNQLLAEMDKAILAMNQDNYQLNANSKQNLLIGKDAFIHKFLFE